MMTKTRKLKGTPPPPQHHPPYLTNNGTHGFTWKWGTHTHLQDDAI